MNGTVLSETHAVSEEESLEESYCYICQESGHRRENCTNCLICENKNAGHTASQCDKRKSAEESLVPIDPDEDFDQLHLVRVTGISDGEVSADITGTGQSVRFPVDGRDETVLVHSEAASRKELLVLQQWESYPSCFTGFVSKVISNNKLEVSFVSKNILNKAVLPMERIKYSEECPEVKHQARVSVGSELLIYVKASDKSAGGAQFRVAMAIESNRTDIVYKTVVFQEPALRICDRCLDHLSIIYPDVHMKMVSSQGADEKIILLVGSGEQLMKEVAEIADLAASHYVECVSTAEESSSPCHEASLLFDVPKEMEDKLAKQLEIYSLFSGVQLLINENCLKAKGSIKKNISDVFEIICTKFSIQNIPFFADLLPGRRDSAQASKAGMKGAVAHVKKERVDCGSEQQPQGKPSGNQTAPDENSSYVESLRASIAQIESSKTGAGMGDSSTAMSKEVKHAKKPIKKPILFPEQDDKGAAKVSFIVGHFGIIDSPEGKVIFHKEDIFDAMGRKMALSSLKKGTQVQYQGYEVSDKIKELCSQLKHFGNDVSLCAKCVYLGPDAPTELKSKSNTLKTMENALQEWKELSLIGDGDAVRNSEPLGSRRVIVADNSGSSHLVVSISKPDSYVRTPCKRLDSILATKTGPCRNHFNFRHCHIGNCPYAHELPVHMNLVFCPTGFLNCLKRCPVVAGELNRNYKVLHNRYKQEIKRLKKNCPNCARAEREEEEYFVVDEYSAAGDDSEDEPEVGGRNVVEHNVSSESEVTATTTESSFQRLVIAEEDHDMDLFREDDSAEDLLCNPEEGESSCGEDYSPARKACKYYNFGKGVCRLGKDCTFLHDQSVDLRNRLRRKSADINRNMPDLRQEKLGRRRSRSRRRTYSTRADVVTIKEVVLDRTGSRSVRCEVADDFLKLVHVEKVLYLP